MIIGSEYVIHENLPSTNSYASLLLKNQKVKEGTVIFAGYQTAGRGVANNKWESEAGKNLLISIILYPHFISPADQFIISKTISLGICDFLNRYTPNVSIKWPNDIYVNDDKIAGILIETSILGDKTEHMIAGIGLNINQKKFLSDSPNPVSLSLITGKEYDIDEVLKNLSHHLDKRYKSLLSGKRDMIDDDYLDNLYRYNISSSYSDSKGVFNGKIISVSPSGYLQIEDDKGKIREYSYKEVIFL